MVSFPLAYALLISNSNSPGVFFLLGAGQLYLMRSQPARAVHFYTKAIECQSQYRNLHHISFWEIAISQLALWDIPASLHCWKVMYEEASVRFPCFLCIVDG
jgi:hypothetical protein